MILGTPMKGLLNPLGVVTHRLGITALDQKPLPGQKAALAKYMDQRASVMFRTARGRT